jgi:hypothetical protein
MVHKLATRHNGELFANQADKFCISLVCPRVKLVASFADDKIRGRGAARCGNSEPTSAFGCTDGRSPGKASSTGISDLQRLSWGASRRFLQ